MYCAISQPCYLPWIGYFNLINNVDTFVFLDDVEFSHQSWQHRNKIIINKDSHLLTLPVKKNNFLIKDIEIDDNKNWRKKHHDSICQSYAKHPFILDVKKIIIIILDKEIINLSDLNTQIIINLCHLLSIKTNFIFSSSLKIKGKRTEKLIKILNFLKCSNYISARGSKNYLESDCFEKNSKINLSFNKDDFPVYEQLNNTKNFISNLSIIDIVANIGIDGLKKYLYNCRL
tara:strand:+ start:679 stop:1371 length:693 start_codon:yes stop_codon:yes gene_type:complete